MRGEDRETRSKRVDWELPADFLEEFRQHCRTYRISEEETVLKALQRYMADRLLEEGE